MAESSTAGENAAGISVDVLIVGAGFSGLGMAIKLLEAGMKDFLLIEKSDEIGGTWYENRYPGCACDVPSHLYSFSFESNAGWTRMFASQPEILQYLKSCVERYGLAPYIRLNTRFNGAAWDESLGVWRITAGENLRIQYVPEDLGHANKDVAMAHLMQEVFRSVYSRPDLIEPDLQSNGLFQTLYDTMETGRSEYEHQQGGADGPR